MHVAPLRPYFGLRSYQDGCKTCAGSPDSYRVKTCSGCGETTSRVKCHNGCGVPMKWTKPEAPADPTCPDCGGTGKGHYQGQLGSEATPAEFLDALLAATREMVRVLKPSGSIFVNLGDKYGRGTRTTVSGSNSKQGYADPGRVAPTGQDKSLLGIPWRYAIACIDDLGLILRAEIIWSKPNGLPESVTDRVRRSHEQWFHMTLQPRYFSAIDEIREPHLVGFNGSTFGGKTRNGVRTGSGERRYGMNTYDELNPLGKLPGSVWDIPTQPLAVPPELGIDHFAAFPMEWPRRIIQGWTPNGVCTACGQGRRPVKGTDWDKVPHRMELRRNRVHSESERIRFGRLFTQWQDNAQIPSREIAALFPSVTGGITGCVGNWRGGLNVLMPEQRDIIEARYGSMPDDLRALIGEMAMMPTANRDMSNVAVAGRNRASGAGLGIPVTSITGYVCGCADATAPTTPAVVLDPFGGTGTTALAAKALGRIGISVDLSHDYCRLAEWRVNDPRELAAALQIDKPEPAHPDQLDLFDGLDTA